jgi:hypothetical protein
MATTHAEAVAALYHSTQESFVAERKRLAAELKAAGDKEGAARLAKMARPSLSAWAVNQLWWQAQPLFTELLSSSERLRKGDRNASSAQRTALAALRTRAATILSEGGHAANDATLRRVTTTLSALAALGGFEPDAPGALSADRDPPGFDAMDGFGGFAAEAAAGPAAAAAAGPAAAAAAAAEAAAKGVAEREELARRERAERLRLQREQEERERKAAEREQLQGALARARSKLEGETETVARLEEELARARQAVERARTGVTELEQKLAALEQGSQSSRGS